MAIPKVKELSAELVNLCKSVPAVAEYSYGVYDLEDLQSRVGLESMTQPIAGVAWGGRRPKITAAAHSPRNPAAGTKTAVMMTHEFMVIIGVPAVGLEPDTNRQTATDLMDDLVVAILGYQKVNSRPWTFVRDGILPDLSNNRALYYHQVWSTDVPMTGASKPIS